MDEHKFFYVDQYEIDSTSFDSFDEFDERVTRKREMRQWAKDYRHFDPQIERLMLDGIEHGIDVVIVLEFFRQKHRDSHYLATETITVKSRELHVRFHWTPPTPAVRFAA